MKINDKNFLPIFFGIQPSKEEMIKIETSTETFNNQLVSQQQLEGKIIKNIYTSKT